MPASSSCGLVDQCEGFSAKRFSQFLIYDCGEIVWPLCKTVTPPDRIREIMFLHEAQCPKQFFIVANLARIFFLPAVAVEDNEARHSKLLSDDDGPGQIALSIDGNKVNTLTPELPALTAGL